jgi:hypothetical protein
MSMRYLPLVTLILATGAACQVSVNGGTGTDPQTPNNVATNTAPTATTTPTATPTATPTDTGPGVHAPRTIGNPTVGGTTTTPNPNLSPTTGARMPAMTGPNDFGTGTQTPDSFTGNIYFIPAASQKIPDLASMKSSGVLYTRNFDIAPRNFDKGFPGVDTRFEWFAIRYTGTLTVAAAGAYGLKVLSDDGAVITIDGNKALDNDGQHAPKTATASVNLTAGTHTFQLDYFQGPRYQVALQVWVTPPAGGEKLLTTSF